jgi:hypothetical protein
LWSQIDNSDIKRFNLGAGQNLIRSSTGSFKWGAIGDFFPFADEHGTFTAVEEGALSDIAVLNNRIEGMASNGISSLTVLGLPNTALGEHSLPHVERLRIDGNTITGNMLWEPPSGISSLHENLIPEAQPRNSIGAEIQSLPLGGIVLATVGDCAEIRNNVIADNHGSPTTATNGIFILSGEGISIIGNRIESNGVPASSNATGNSVSVSTTEPSRGAPGNSVSVSTTEPSRGVRAGIAIMLAGTGNPGSLGDLAMILLSEGGVLSNDGSSVRILDNVVQQPEGRALHVIAAGPVMIQGNFLSSQGFHGSDNPEDQFAIGDVVLVENVGGPWERFDIDQVNILTDYISSGGFDDNQSLLTVLDGYLNNTVQDSPRFFVGIGGQVLFHNNQVVYDWTIQRTPPPNSGVPLGIFPLAFLTLDHLSVVGNCLSLHIENPPVDPPLPDPDLAKIKSVRHTPMLAHVFGAAATLDISANRVAGGVADTLLSIWGLGELASSMTSNQTTLDNFSRSNHATGFTPQYLDTDNQVMFDEGITNSNFKFFNDTLQLFFRLLFRPGSMGSPLPPPT